jgi:hypothetical protein
MSKTKTLNNFDEAHFYNEERIMLYSLEDEQKSFLEHMYNKAKVDLDGFSHSDGKSYLKMIKVLKYLSKARVSYMIKPIVLIKNESGNISESEINKYDDLLGEKNKSAGDHGFLSYMTYYHILSNGRIIESLIQMLDDTTTEDVYNETLRIRDRFTLSEKLNEDLPVNESSKRSIKL